MEGRRQTRAEMDQFRRYQMYREKLRERPCSRRELAEVVCRSEKTVQRDLDLLRAEWGWQVKYDARSRRWEAEGSLPLAVLRLTPDEALALLLAEPALRAYGSGPFGPALRSAMEKIGSSLEVPLPERAPPIGFELHPLRETDPHLLQRLARAATARERLELTYFTPERRETTTRQIDPYLVYNHEGGWYVAAYCHRRKALIDFAISSRRMLGLENTGERFTPDMALDLDRYRQEGFGIFKGGEVQEVALRFGVEQAIYQWERMPQPGEVREEQADGSLIVRFRAPVNIGLKRWVLQYGAEVEVLAPGELRDWVREQAGRMLRETQPGPEEDR